MLTNFARIIHGSLNVIRHRGGKRLTYVQTAGRVHTDSGQPNRTKPPNVRFAGLSIGARDKRILRKVSVGAGEIVIPSGD